MTEVVDELSQDAYRTSLLDRVESQLKGKTHCSRILVGFHVVDDKQVHSKITQEFSTWRQQSGGGSELTGLLLFTVQGALHFLEGPTELLFSAIEQLHILAQEIVQPEEAMRPALTGPIRVLHFSELHGARAAGSWCSYTHTGKAASSQLQIEETNSAEMMFRAYHKFLLVCSKIQDEGTDVVSTSYKKAQEQLPTVDEVAVLVGKAAAEFFFSFEEFHKVFVAPFNLTLHSELLWPMSTALSY